MMGGLMTMLLCILPMAHLISNSTHIFIPFVIGAIGTSAYTKKRDKNYIKVFQHFNRELKENALIGEKKHLDEEKKTINTNCESKIEEISLIKVHLEEYKQWLTSIPIFEQEKNLALTERYMKEKERLLQ